MRSVRWWHAAVLGIAAVLAVLLVADPRTALTMWAGLGVVAGFVIVWFALSRRVFADPRVDAALVVVVILVASVGAAVHPSFATFQCLAFPLIWSLIEALKPTIAANIALAVGVGVGMYFSTGSLATAVLIEGISLAFSVALGLWITSIAHTSSERQRLLDELTAAQEKLSTLDRDAGVASERERLAREIHDTIAQDLTGLVMLTQRAQRELVDGVDASVTLELLEESARTALAETRALVASSAPVGLATGGISDALERLGDRFGRETGIDVTVEADGLPAIDRDTEVVLLRCAQEGLSNVRKHAAASTATVAVWAADGSVALRVEDDGSGFDPDAATDGYGLGGMRDRLALVGGSLDVASSPAGTVLTATLPVVSRS